MEAFGWLMMILLAMFGLFVLGILIGPYVISKVKTFMYRLQTYIDDEKLDTDKRSEERRNRDETKRQKDFELANKKLDAKINKVNKQISLQSEKLKLAEELKNKNRQANIQRIKTVETPVVEQAPALEVVEEDTIEAEKTEE